MGNFGCVKSLDDVLGGFEQAAGRIELDDEALVVLCRRDFRCAGDVAGRGRADGPVNFDQPDLRGLGDQAEKHTKNRDVAQCRIRFPIRIQPNKCRHYRK